MDCSNQNACAGPEFPAGKMLALFAYSAFVHAMHDAADPAAPAQAAARSGSPVIEVVDLHKSFGPLEVLKGVSLTAHEGEVVALIGSSGSGKSTLLRCINMLEIPDTGSIRIAGEEIALSGRPPNRRVADERQ